MERYRVEIAPLTEECPLREGWREYNCCGNPCQILSSAIGEMLRDVERLAKILFVNEEGNYTIVVNPGE